MQQQDLGQRERAVWIDPNKKVTGTIMTQVIPFADATFLKLYNEFERGVYDALKSA